MATISHSFHGQVLLQHLFGMSVCCIECLCCPYVMINIEFYSYDTGTYCLTRNLKILIMHVDGIGNLPSISEFNY